MNTKTNAAKAVKTEDAEVVDNTRTPSGLVVTHNFEVEDYTAEKDAYDEAPVVETETELTSGLSLVSYT